MEKEVNVHCVLCGNVIGKLQLHYIDSEKHKCEACEVEFYVDLCGAVMARLTGK